MSLILEYLGLTISEVRTLAEQAKPLSPEQVRRACARDIKKGSRGRAGLPKYAVETMYQDYLRLHSLSQAGRLYGRTRQVMYDIFKAHKLPLYKRNFQQRILYGGEVFTPGKDGYFRGTQGKRQPLHHRIWQDKFGPIPAGCQVMFKDGDNMNFSPENLDCRPIQEVTRHHQTRLLAAGLHKNQIGFTRK